MAKTPLSPPAASILALSPDAALMQMIETNRLLLAELDQIEQGNSEEETDTLTAATAKREQLLQQVFSQPWSPEAVAQHQADFQTLEALDQALREKAESVREALHQRRSKNQHNRKAVNAYGQARHQFSR